MSIRSVWRGDGAASRAAPGPDAPAPLPDFRTAAERKSDARLVGIWWRCSVHGLMDDAIVLAGLPFCSDPDCNLRVLVVASARQPKSSDRSWGWSGDSSIVTFAVQPTLCYSVRAIRCTIRECMDDIAPPAAHVRARFAQHRQDTVWCVLCGARSSYAQVRDLVKGAKR